MATNETQELKFQLLDSSNRNRELYILAGSSSISPAMRAELSKSRDTRIRLRIAESEQTSQFLLLELSRDSESEVRLAVADNPSTSDYVLKRLAADEDLDVRYGMASNPHLSPNILLSLTGDINPYVCDRAKRTIARNRVATATLPAVLRIPTSSRDEQKQVAMP